MILESSTARALHSTAILIVQPAVVDEMRDNKLITAAQTSNTALTYSPQNPCEIIDDRHNRVITVTRAHENRTVVLLCVWVGGYIPFGDIREGMHRFWGVLCDDLGFLYTVRKRSMHIVRSGPFVQRGAHGHLASPGCHRQPLSYCSIARPSCAVMHARAKRALHSFVQRLNQIIALAHFNVMYTVGGLYGITPAGGRQRLCRYHLAKRIQYDAPDNRISI